MNALLDNLPAISAADEMTLESALAARGWEQQSPDGWRLPTEHGDCLLIEISNLDCWRQLELCGGSTPRSANRSVLEDNFRLFGPTKLVARAGNHSICRLDVPDALADTSGRVFDADGRLQLVDSAAAWATAVTDLATGKCKMGPRAAELESAIADELKQAGWSTSLDGDQFHIHVQLPGVYRQLALELDAHSGVKLATELVDLVGIDRECILAMRHLASEVNARVPLVRLAISGSVEKQALRAEIGFGATLIPGTFLLMSLHAMETTVALCARELEALRDPELARLVLAAAAARKSDVWSK